MAGSGSVQADGALLRPLRRAPPDPLAEWRNPPFEPTIEGELVVARGATDDKGQSYCHVKGVGAMLAERGALPVNVKFIVEGEEESGGQAIEAFVREWGAEKLACDCVVVSDSSMFAPGVPALTYGLKGCSPTSSSGSSAVDRSGRDVRPELAATDGAYLVSPDRGDRTEIMFAAPPLKPGLQRTLFIKACGYYKSHIDATGTPRLDLAERVLTEPGFAARHSFREYLKWQAGLRAEVAGAKR